MMNAEVPTQIVGANGMDGLGGNGMGLWALLLLAMRGNGFGYDGRGCDPHQMDLLVAKAIENKQEAVQELARKIGCDVDTLKLTLCDVKAKLSEVHGRVECAIDALQRQACKLESIDDKLCGVEKEVLRQGYETQLRDLQNTATIVKAVECEGERTRRLIEDNEKARLRDERDCYRDRCNRFEARDGEREYNTNVNFGTQIQQITTALNSILAKG